MNRRTALKFFGVTGAAAMLLPGCLSDTKKVSVALESLRITVEDEELLAQIAETMIPATDKPGARQVGAHIFTFVMVDDCHSSQEKDRFLKGLRAFNEKAPVPGGKEFIDASPQEKLKTLETMEGKTDGPDDDLAFFYKTTKRYVVQGYTTSEYFLTEVKQFKLVPGPVFKGCVPVSDNI